MTPQQKAFLPPFCSACIQWEATSDFEYKRQITIVSIAQGALETGWGISSLCKVNNYGGVKDHLPQWPPLVKETREVIGGKDVVITDKFQTYPTIADYVADHAAVLLRWECVRTAAGISLVALCEALGPWTPEDRKSSNPSTSNYSTDPHYGSTLMLIIDGLMLDAPGKVEQFASGTGF